MLMNRKIFEFINYVHNSNLELRQVTLSGEILQEEKFYVLGFVSADVVNLKKEVWFSKLDYEQISNLEEYLEKRASNFA
jgi:hypothetical protein